VKKLTGLKHGLMLFFVTVKQVACLLSLLNIIAHNFTFLQFIANPKNINEVMQLTADLLRGFMLDLETRGRNAGGRHAGVKRKPPAIQTGGGARHRYKCLIMQARVYNKKI
jgi:hypothetical protein